MADIDLDALRKQHGRISYVKYNGHDIAFRKPTAAEAQMYRACASDTQEDKFEQTSTMAQLILVHPTLPEWHALADDYPFMLSNESVNHAIAIAMGVLEEKKGSTASAAPKKAIPNASPAASPSGSPSAPGVS